MEELKEELPISLEDAIEKLKEFYKKYLSEIKNMKEDDFKYSSHFWSGMYIRNSWQLWWSEGHQFLEWSNEIPPLNKWFNSIDIYHADDMSAILLTCLYRNLNDIPYDLDNQVKFYKNHWKNEGFKDGIYKNIK